MKHPNGRKMNVVYSAPHSAGDAIRMVHTLLCDESLKTHEIEGRVLLNHVGLIALKKSGAITTDAFANCLEPMIEAEEATGRKLHCDLSLTLTPQRSSFPKGSRPFAVVEYYHIVHPESRWYLDVDITARPARISAEYEKKYETWAKSIRKIV